LVPIVAYRLLYQLFLYYLNSRYIIIDFNYLPPPDLTNILLLSTLAFYVGDPLIISIEKIDYRCYLSVSLFYNILFPTNFQDLTYYAKKLLHYNNIANRKVESNKQADFSLSLEVTKLIKQGIYLVIHYWLIILVIILCL